MIRKLLAAAALAAILPHTAQAQRSGTYAVEGQSPDGSRYEGAVQLQATGPQTWRITWRISGTNASGVALTVGNLLVVGYVSNRETGAAAYEVMPDGRLVGRWTQGPNGGLGTEILLPR